MTDWNHELCMAGSEHRGPVLLAAHRYGKLSDKDMIDLINDWWTSCEAWGDDLPAALDMLAEYKPVGNEPLPVDLSDLSADFLTVYRATDGETPDGGSWTLHRDVADKFARMMCSARGWFLFGKMADEPVIWSGQVHRDDVLGYFTDRAEAEVVIPDGAVTEVYAVAKLVKTPAAA